MYANNFSLRPQPQGLRVEFYALHEKVKHWMIFLGSYCGQIVKVLMVEKV
jgi:hypothetical protein